MELQIHTPRTNYELLTQLGASVSGKEWEQLEAHELFASEFNYESLRMIRKLLTSSVRYQPPGLVPETVDGTRVDRCVATLQQFLAECYSERPDAHKWIILSCVYLAFLAKLPLHPAERVGYQTRQQDGILVYYCPMREDRVGSTCEFCVCRKLTKSEPDTI